MRGPGIPAGLRLSQRVANIDLAPTIVDAAGATSGRVMDGRSLLPVIASPGMSLNRDLLVERGPGQGTFTALRAPNYFYAEYGNGEQELYDLARDPYQLTSRHADPAYAALEGRPRRAARAPARLQRAHLPHASVARRRPAHPANRTAESCEGVVARTNAGDQEGVVRRPDLDLLIDR